jgi:exopolysaccharide biosynthesis polyprenyl glycosylphosphotransferase
MIANCIKGLAVLHYAWQCAVGMILFAVWFFVIVSGIYGGDAHFDQYFVYSIIFVVGFAFNFLRSEVGNTNLLQLTFLSNHRLALTQTVTILGTILVYLFAVRDEMMSRVFLFTFVPLLYGYLYLSNRYFPRILAKLMFNGQRRCRTVLLGSRRNASRLGDWLRQKAHYGLESVGFIAGEKILEKGDSLPVQARVDEIERVMRESRASLLLVLEMPDSLECVAVLSDICDGLGARLMIVNDMEERLRRSISFVEDEGFNFMSPRLEPLDCARNRMVKRAVDIVIALPVVVFVLPPVSVLVWIAQRFQAPGTLFSKQLRTGLRGSEFEIIRFRTKYVHESGEAREAKEDNNRFYPFGRFLQKLCIDELPQFLNVLRGEMSIVGPRPHLMHHDILFGEIERYYRVRSFIKPGITGLAQVRGLRGEVRREKDLLDRIQSDLYYLENWSIILDWFIILKTAYQVVKPPKTSH